MVELFEKDICKYHRQSAKGNQLKWFSNHIWYKADYTGYEGFSEYIISKLFDWSTLEQKEYIHYNTEEIKYKYTTYKGCRSENFLPAGL